jgi:hypothetical protein
MYNMSQPIWAIISEFIILKVEVNEVYIHYVTV